MKYLICLLLLCSVVMAGSVTGTLTSTATVVSKVVPTFPTTIVLSNGVVITKDLPKDVIINTFKEKNNLVRINIIY